MVMKKLRPRAPLLTADMDPELLEEVIRTLFPPQEDSPGQPRTISTWNGGRNQGLRKRRCWMRRRKWPPATWRRDRDGYGRRPQTTSPIYKVSEGGSLHSNMKHGEQPPPGWTCFGRRDDRQTRRPHIVRCAYWMKWASSSKESLPPVWRPTYQGECQGGVALVVSLDIDNAFNTILWNGILEALEFFEVPPYIIRVIRAYLSDRWVSYTDKDGEGRWPVKRVVPQGSVLGPILWIIGYDAVLRCSVPPDLGMVCYADNTLILARRRWETPPPRLCLDISGEDVEVGPQMKYLGLTIDSHWMFGPHFKLLVFKAFWFLMTANALCGLLPNDPTDGGAEIGVRRLYEGVIHSRVLYGAPVWAEDLMKSLHSLLLLRRLHRTTAIRCLMLRVYKQVFQVGCR
ncbi:uncharacterized protein LOC125386317 [Bombus terrestris]|uniref:Uncharacterized protein LOC125386317 n=1 Tax=Bombus terrestris TaxID=30195 RepID=A0A9C6SW38_BOMTE|nr:uncharacterized protein LOC125386317 [Bombus terrestris]